RSPASQAAEKAPSASLAPSAAGSTYKEYASPAAFGRRLASGAFSAAWGLGVSAGEELREGSIDVREVFEEEVGALGFELGPRVWPRGHGDRDGAEVAGALDVARRVADHENLLGSEPAPHQRLRSAGGQRRELAPIVVVRSVGAELEIRPEPRRRQLDPRP